MTPVFLDCDPGHDDAFAILLAVHSGATRLIGVSTVAGNQSVEKTTRNAKKVLALAGAANVPVIRGQDQPLLARIRHDPEIHGDCGLEGSPELDSFAASVGVNHTMENDHKILWLERVIDIITSEKDKVTLVATGALTNIALLLTLCPKILNHISQISIMGGAIGIGNRSPVAEFNILVDPEAAKIVFESGAKVVMIPLEVTHTALATETVMKKILDMKTPFAKVAVDLLSFFKSTYKKTFGMNDPPVHDPCAIAYVIAPEIFTLKHLVVDVITGDHKCKGQTVCDIWRDYYIGRKPNVYVATKMNVDEFWDMMCGALRRCDKVTPINEYVMAQKKISKGLGLVSRL